MNLKDFNNNLMSTKIVFDEEGILPGDVINLFKIDATATSESFARFYRSGIVYLVTPSLIKYSCYDYSNEEITTSYLYPADVLVMPITHAQWEDKDSLYIFKIIREGVPL
jgi:hypothetical protein